MATVRYASYSLTDYAGRRGTHKIFWPASTETLAEVITFAQDYAAVLDALTGMIISGINVNLEVTPPLGLKGGVVANADRQEGLLTVWDCTNTQYNFGMYIPGINPAVMSGQELDIAALSDGAAWRDFILAGAAPIVPSNDHGEVLATLLSTERRFRRK